MVEDEWQLFHERMDNPARFLKNEGKEALVFWQTKNVSTKVIELLIGFEALGEFYSPAGKLLEFRELVAAYSGGYPFSISGDIRSVPS